jgi:hypothetical protein
MQSGIVALKKRLSERVFLVECQSIGENFGVLPVARGVGCLRAIKGIPEPLAHKRAANAG